MAETLLQCLSAPLLAAVLPSKRAAQQRHRHANVVELPSLLEADECALDRLPSADDAHATHRSSTRNAKLLPRSALRAHLERRIVDALLLHATPDRRTYGALAQVSRVFGERARALLVAKLAQHADWLRCEPFVGEEFAKSEHWHHYVENARMMDELIARDRIIGHAGHWIRLYRDGMRMRGKQPVSHGYRHRLSARLQHGLQRVYAHDDALLHECTYALGELDGEETRRWTSAPHHLLLQRTWNRGKRVREHVFFAQNVHVALRREWQATGAGAPLVQAIVFYDTSNVRPLLQIEKRADAPHWTYTGVAGRDAAYLYTQLEHSPLPGAYMLSHDLLAALQNARHTDGLPTLRALPMPYRHWYLVQRNSPAHALLHYLRFAHPAAVQGCFETAQVLHCGPSRESMHVLYCPLFANYYEQPLWDYARDTVLLRRSTSAAAAAAAAATTSALAGLGEKSRASVSAPSSISQHLLDMAVNALLQLPHLARSAELLPMLPKAFPGTQYIH